MPASAVVDHDVGGERHGASDHVPRRRHVLGAVDPLDVGGAAGGDDDDIGLQSQDVAGFGVRVEANLDAEPLQLRLAPVDDTDDVAPPACALGHQQLSAQFLRCFQQHDLVPAHR